VNDKLSTFVDGFLGGLGLVLIMWGFASIVMLPFRSANIYVGMILFGVISFAGGLLREAYQWGKISGEPKKSLKPSITPRLAASHSVEEPQCIEATEEHIKNTPVETQNERTHSLSARIEELEKRLEPRT